MPTSDAVEPNRAKMASIMPCVRGTQMSVPRGQLFSSLWRRVCMPFSMGMMSRPRQPSKTHCTLMTESPTSTGSVASSQMPFCVHHSVQLVWCGANGGGGTAGGGVDGGEQRARLLGEVEREERPLEHLVQREHVGRRDGAGRVLVGAQLVDELEPPLLELDERLELFAVRLADLELGVEVWDEAALLDVLRANGRIAAP